LKRVVLPQFGFPMTANLRVSAGTSITSVSLQQLDIVFYSVRETMIDAASARRSDRR
jgi:hypothetical protein